ncbi:MAG: hypothetical protein ACOC7S_00620 [Planctomycetota bacterium]
MIKLSASMSKKVPLPDVEYSSHSCTAGMEVEMSDSSTSRQLAEKLQRIYALLEECVDEQLEGERQEEPARLPSRARRSLEARIPENNGRPATDAQIRAMRAIARDRGISTQEFDDQLEREFGVRSPSGLTLSQASRVIDRLKSRKEARA